MTYININISGISNQYPPYKVSVLFDVLPCLDIDTNANNALLFQVSVSATTT